MKNKDRKINDKMLKQSLMRLYDSETEAIAKSPNKIDGSLLAEYKSNIFAEIDRLHRTYFKVFGLYIRKYTVYGFIFALIFFAFITYIICK